jgi:hypothetical protein
MSMEVLRERCAALDISKRDVKACVRVPNPNRKGARSQEVRTFASMANALLQLKEWLASEQVSVVTMEATGDYWDSQKLHQTGSGCDGSAAVGGLSHGCFVQEVGL